MHQLRSHVFGAVSALLAQFPVGFVFIALPLISSDYPFLRLAELIGVYWFATALVAAPIIIFLGIPVFHLLRRKGLDNYKSLAMSGAAIAAVISAVLLWPIESAGYSSGGNYYGTYRNMIVDGSPTLWGWIRFVEDIVMFAVHGAIGGIAFRYGWQKAVQSAVAETTCD